MSDQKSTISAEPALVFGDPLPVAARGVASASVLLTDGGGPVYNRYSPVTLPAALEAAIAQLDPALPLMHATDTGTGAAPETDVR